MEYTVLRKDYLLSKLRNIAGPLLLIICCPSLAILVWYINASFDGSLMSFAEALQKQGIWQTFYKLWQPRFLGSAVAWQVIGVFAAIQLTLMRVVPGKRFQGPATPKGNIPVYKANGPACFLITLALYYLSAYQFSFFSPTIVYDHFGEILGALNLFSLLFCALLYFKGRLAPSSSDHGISGNPIFDYYWGTELYPRIAGWDVKMFTNCRFGMMSWGVIILSFAAKQAQVHGLSDSMVVAVALQLAYIFKFFCWETGYLRSLDIMHDRAGYYICWGCLVWVPAIYTSPILYLVNHPHHLGWVLSSTIFLLGIGSILMNYAADRQRQRVRAKQGECLVWGKTPKLIVANYVTGDGEKRTNVLLASGWWGIARHFHYVPEVLASFFWTVPALFTGALPYFYVVFLSILLHDRARRDDKRCALKYGEDWERYCKEVPYKILPFIH